MLETIATMPRWRGLRTGFPRISKDKIQHYPSFLY